MFLCNRANESQHDCEDVMNCACTVNCALSKDYSMTRNKIQEIDSSGLLTQTAKSILSSELQTLQPSQQMSAPHRLDQEQFNYNTAKFTAMSLATCNEAPAFGYRRLKLNLDGETIHPKSLSHDLSPTQYAATPSTAGLARSRIPLKTILIVTC